MNISPIITTELVGHGGGAEGLAIRIMHRQHKETITVSAFHRCTSHATKLSSNGEKQATGTMYHAKAEPITGAAAPQSRPCDARMMVELTFMMMKDIEQKRARDGSRTSRKLSDNTLPM